ncbi:MAG: hypothetical protein MZV49_24345 [Rhodopseudomonas palustris]|nr:hypothetical protein [Rhodopseudomonas palustris]
MGKVERVREAEAKVDTWKQSVRDSNDVIARARKTGDQETASEYASRARRAKEQLALAERDLVKAKKETPAGTGNPEVQSAPPRNCRTRSQTNITPS